MNEVVKSVFWDALNHIWLNILINCSIRPQFSVIKVTTLAIESVVFLVSDQGFFSVFQYKNVLPQMTRQNPLCMIYILIWRMVWVSKILKEIWIKAQRITCIWNFLVVQAFNFRLKSLNDTCNVHGNKKIWWQNMWKTKLFATDYRENKNILWLTILLSSVF